MPRTATNHSRSSKPESSFGFISIHPGSWVSFPAVDIICTPFSIYFKVRTAKSPGAVGSVRQILLSDWGNMRWQFICTLETDGRIHFGLRRDMWTAGELDRP